MQYYHEPSYNLLYIPALETDEKSSKKSGGIFSSLKSSSYHEEHFHNLALFDIQSGEQRLIFKPEELNGDSVVYVLFEVGYDPEEKALALVGNAPTMNNQAIAPAELGTWLLVGTVGKTNTTIWRCDKLGMSRQKLASFSNEYSWHLDIANRKLRVLHFENDLPSIQQYDWR